MTIKIVKRQSGNSKVQIAVLQDVAKSFHVKADLAMCDGVRSITIGTGSTAKKIKSLFLHDKR